MNKIARLAATGMLSATSMSSILGGRRLCGNEVSAKINKVARNRAKAKQAKASKKANRK